MYNDLLRLVRIIVLLVTVASACDSVGCMPPSWGAGGLLHPARRVVTRKPERPFESVQYQGAGIKLSAWRYPASGTFRGTLVYLHGAADNRGSSIGIADHFVPKGFDVVAFDSRAHGDSEGKYCTYGYYEKEDLRKVLDTLRPGPIILFGSSLGAAVALQTAAIENRVSAVISVATFSDLRTVGKERAPFIASQTNIRDAFAIAEKRADFKADDVSPEKAAARIHVPVFLIHGKQDDETPPAHSQRVFDALSAKKTLVMVPGAGHNVGIDAELWKQIDAWLEESVNPRQGDLPASGTSTKSMLRL